MKNTLSVGSMAKKRIFEVSSASLSVAVVVELLDGVVICLFAGTDDVVTGVGVVDAGAARGNAESPSERFETSNGARTIGTAVFGSRSSVETRRRLTPTTSIVFLK